MREFRRIRSILVTGGAGFIGSNFVRYLFNHVGFRGTIVNLDKLTYAGNPRNLDDVTATFGRRYVFVRGDVCDRSFVRRLMAHHRVDTVVHFAAESHVDRSIVGPEAFVRTNVEGTASLLDACRAVWRRRTDVLFHHVSTDEVFGSLGRTGYFSERSPYAPRSPYAATKAAADHLVRAYGHTYGIPYTISNCSNNYGPYQFPEKMIPLMILNMLRGKPLPVYGDGRQVRDWLYVLDHCDAVWRIVAGGAVGATYTVSGGTEWENIRLVHELCRIVSDATGVPESRYRRLITYVADRPGHDRRYAMRCTRMRRELGWRRSVSLEHGLRLTVRWYLDHADWVREVTSGAYRRWVRTCYTGRQARG